MKRNNYTHAVIITLFVVFFPTAIIFGAERLDEKLKGRILLQVEQYGEAWYVHPTSLQRHYLGRPNDAFRIMREQGLGITTQNLGRIASHNDVKEGDRALAKKLAGRILLQVQSHGEAWYVNPLTLRRHYLGRPNDAFALMRSLGLGITNSDLEKILTIKSQGPTQKQKADDNNLLSTEHLFVIPENHKRISPAVYDVSGKHFAYVIKKGDGEAVVHDGKEHKPLAVIFRDSYSSSSPKPPKLIFSPDGKRLMYGGRSLKDWGAVFIVDGKQILSTHEDIEAYGFSPDSQHTYIIQLADSIKIIDEGIHESDTLYIDGGKYKTAFPALRIHVPRFVDGTIIPVYWTGDPKSDKRTLVIGEEKIGEYSVESGEPIFSPDGTRYAFRSGGVFEKVAKVIVDGKQMGANYENVESIAFSTDSMNVLFEGTRNGKKILVKNGIEQEVLNR